jgi:hypothetical protein
MMIGAHWPYVAASRAVQEDIDFLGPPSGVGQRVGDFLGFLRVLAKNLVAGPSCGNEPNHCADGHTPAPDAGLPAHYGGVTSNAR